MRILLPLAMLLFACGPKLPPRYVLERDVEGYRYRRYQQVLDVELPIAGNPAVGHTATYVRGGDTVKLAPVFVTVYERPKGLAETVRARLRAMSSYTFDVVEREGGHLFRLRGDSGDSWLVWVSGPHLVKLGAPEGEKDVPAPLIAAYLDLYPSDLDDKGHPEQGAASAGAPVDEAGSKAPTGEGSP